MKLKATRADVWAASIPDQPGGLAAKLEALAEAGVNLEFVIARRESSQPGTGVVFVTPIKRPKHIRAAQAAGFQKTDTLHSVRIEGKDKPGLGAKITASLAAAGINLRGLSAAAIGKRCVCHLALDKPEDAEKAIQILKKKI